MDVNILSTAGDVVMRHPLITFIEHLILILNINKKKGGFNTIEQLAVHSSILSLLFSSVLFASFALRLLLLLCYCTLVPRTARLLRFTTESHFIFVSSSPKVLLSRGSVGLHLLTIEN